MFPPRSILAAIDFSEQSRGALMMAARLARRTGATLHVIYAEDPLLAAAAAAQGGIDLRADTQAELTAFIASVPAAAACAPELEVVEGAAAGVILHAAGRCRADLIVVGARGMSGAGRLLFGSVTEDLLLRADRSVLVVPDWWSALAPADDEPGAWGPLIVGIDFTEPSLLAAGAACALAQVLRAPVEAIHVVPELRVPDRWKPQAERVLAERVDLARRDLAAFLGGLHTPVSVTRQVETGSIVERLTEIAAPIGDRHPWLVLGRRSKRSTAGTPGAIAYRVASLARVPVLMHKETES